MFLTLTFRFSHRDYFLGTCRPSIRKSFQQKRLIFTLTTPSNLTFLGVSYLRYLFKMLGQNDCTYKGPFPEKKNHLDDLNTSSGNIVSSVNYAGNFSNKKMFLPSI